MDYIGNESKQNDIDGDFLFFLTHLFEPLALPAPLMGNVAVIQSYCKKRNLLFNALASVLFWNTQFQRTQINHFWRNNLKFEVISESYFVYLMFVNVHGGHIKPHKSSSQEIFLAHRSRRPFI